MKKKLLYIINDVDFFISHRLNIALTAQTKGYEIHLIANHYENITLIMKYGLKFHPITINRSGKSIFAEIKTFTIIFKLIKEIKPDLVHLVTIKPIIYGGIAAKILKQPKIISAISGLGYVFTNQKSSTKILKKLIIQLYKLALNSKNNKVIFQNSTDLMHFLQLNIIQKHQAHLIPGSGVIIENYPFKPENESIIKTITFASRILKDKGILEFIEACKILEKKDIKANFIICGKIDPGNPSSIDLESLNQLIKETNIQYIGFQTDSYHFYNSHIVVLPSYREGLPKVLSEAAACGRAIITTNVPGCKDAIIPNKTGLLVEVKNASDLALKMEYLITHNQIRKNMGINGRKFAEKQFNLQNVINEHLKLYES